MTKHCAVSGCKSGTSAERKRMKLNGQKQISLFSMPKSQGRIDAWNDALGITNRKKLSSGDVVCELHFRAEDVKRQFVTIMPDGTAGTISRGRCCLKENALPIIIQSKDGTVNSEDSKQRLRLTASTANTVQEGIVPSYEMPTFVDQEAKAVKQEEKVLEQCAVKQEEKVLEQCAVEQEEKVLEQCAVEQEEKVLEQCPVNDENLWVDGGCDVKHIDIENCTNGFDSDAYSLDTLVENLQRGQWRKNWVWQLRDNPQSVQFVEFDTNLSPRIYCSINVNMKITISVGDKSVLREIDRGTLKSFDQMMTLLDTLETIEVCIGTGRDEEKRAADCPGFPDVDNTYRKNCEFQQCLPCRNLRHKLQTG